LRVDDQSFRALEEALLDPAVRRSQSALSALIADDFVEFGSSGVASDKQGVLDAASRLPDVVTPLSDFAVDSVSDSVVLVTYRSATRLDRGLTRAALRSSLWVLRDGRWQLRFHQGTTADASD
jgi:hypothetical protein